jgi:hypothetical protein
MTLRTAPLRRQNRPRPQPILWHARDGALKIILAVLGAAGYGVRGDTRTDHINLRRPLVLVPEAYNV